jgi:hypothetical protein
MKIAIQETMRISDIQQAFTKAYPFLKIEFYDHPHGWGEGCGKDKKISASTHIKELVFQKDPPAFIEFLPWQKVGELETLLQQMGLFVQVWRKYGEGWIETAGTDELTFDEQNDLGRSSVIKDHEQLWAGRSSIY